MAQTISCSDRSKHPPHPPQILLADRLQQQLSKKAVEIAEEFKDSATKARYRKLAEKLRLPYWDWAKKTADNELIMPRSISQPTISITFPNGTQATVDNPISVYRFHPLKPEEILSPYDKTPVTIRNANFFTEPSQPEAQENLLKNEIPWTKQTLYVILSQYQTYNQFSNSGSEWTGLGNIESVHDSIHGTFGLHSHMGSPSVAAFDPGFYFHHANVDRMLALFERLHPETWVTPHQQNGIGTWTIQPNSVQDANSPLTPFRRNARGDYHTSATVRNFETLKYTYPELVDKPSNATLIARINQMYQVPMTDPFKHKRQETAPPLAISAEEPRAYLCSIEAPKIAGTYKVELLLGEDAVGGATVMSALPTKLKSKASVPLTNSLKKKFDDGEIDSLDKEKVVEYLKENLHWRVQQGDLDVPTSGIKVTVASTEVKAPESESDFPVFVGGFEEHLEVPEA